VVGARSTLRRRGFITDDPERARDEVCRLLAALPLRANVTFGLYRPELSFAENYLGMFRWLMTWRMGASDWDALLVECDSHQEVGQPLLEAAVRDLSERLWLRHSRRPRCLPVVRCPRKAEEPLLLVPDYLLAVAGAYLGCGSTSMEKMQVRRFEQLRDKYRLIRDFDRHRSYNRQRVIGPEVVLQGREQTRSGT